MQIAGGLAQPVDGIEHGQDARQQVPPGVADPRAVPAALQDVDAEFLLQVAHGLAQRRLGDVQLFGRPPERAEAGHRGDVLELFGAHDESCYSA